MPDEHSSPPPPPPPSPPVPRGMAIPTLMMGQPAPRIYANSFQVAPTNADIVVELRHLGVQVAIVSLSFALAKTLHQKLGAVVANIESKLGKEIPTTDDFDRAFRGVKTP